MNVYEELGLSSVINAAGRMTKLGVSCINDEVAAALINAAQNYVDIDELYKAAGKKISALIGCADACVTASASSGIALAVASLLCGNDLQKVQHFKKTQEEAVKKEVILLKGHNVDFGAPIDLMIETGGGCVVEAGYANRSSIEDITNLVTDKTLAIFFVKSHHCVQKNMVDVQHVIKAANQLNIPVIVDASAEEDLSVYHAMGADFVCYSGAKALSGPTSGFVACKNEKDADHMRLQYKGIGRTMKIGKENTIGLVKAVEVYQRNHGYLQAITLSELEAFTKQVNAIPGLQAEMIQDESGREIYRSKINVDESIYGMNALHLTAALKCLHPAIYIREHLANLGSIAVDPRPLNSCDELSVIEEALLQLGKR